MIDLRRLELTLGLGLIASACEPEPVEETHVLLTECAELSCEPMTVVIDIMPASALECSQALYDNGQPGLVTLLTQVDGDPYPPHQEDMLLLLADGRVLRQQRERNCGDRSFCQDGPWKAWGPHTICNVSSGYFAPEANIVGCEEVRDWTCEEVQAALMP